MIYRASKSDHGQSSSSSTSHSSKNEANANGFVLGNLPNTSSAPASLSTTTPVIANKHIVSLDHAGTENLMTK